MSSHLTRFQILEMVRDGKIDENEALGLLKENIKWSKERIKDLVYYENIWLEEKIVVQDKKKYVNEKILLFLNKENYDRILIDDLAKSYQCSFLIVLPGRSFCVKDKNLYIINPADYNDYLTLLNKCKDGLKCICHYWSDSEFSENSDLLDKQLKESIFSLFNLAKSIDELKIKDEVKIFYFYKNFKVIEAPQYACVGSFGKVIRLENNRIIIKAIGIDSGNHRSFIEICLAEFFSESNDCAISYRNNARYVKKYIHANIERSYQSGSIKFTDHGTYIITGGAGGLGLIFCRFIARRVNANIILVGRSKLSKAKRAKIDVISQEYKSNVSYFQADISRESDVVSLVDKVKHSFSSISGIIHAAGIYQNAFFTQLTDRQFKQTIIPKIYGSIYLDKVTKNEPLDFFIMFSSVSAVSGDIGLSAYGYANSFLDYFSLYRQSLVLDNKRSGLSVAIDWPLWEAGGIQIDERVKKLLKKNTGMVPLDTSKGTDSLEIILCANKYQIGVAEGDKDIISQKLAFLRIYDFNRVYKPFDKKIITQTITEQKVPSITQNKQVNLRNEVEQDFVDIISKVLRIDSDNININEDFDIMGFDSINFTEFSKKINNKFNINITPAIFYQYTKPDSCIIHLLETYRDELDKIYVKVEPVELQMPEAIKDSLMEENRQGIIKASIQTDVIELVSNILGINKENFSIEEEMDDLGFDSITFTEFANKLNKNFNLLITPAIFYEHKTLLSLSEYLLAKYPGNFEMRYKKQVVVKKKRSPSILFKKNEPLSQNNRLIRSHERNHSKVSVNEPVAIIGIDGIFPKSPDLKTFWKNLENAKDCISFIPGSRWDWKLYDGNVKTEDNKTYAKWGGFVDEIEYFDSKFFGVSALEAELMDPQQRIVLQTVWRALEDAGIKPSSLAGSDAAVFVGAAASDYYELLLENNVPLQAHTGSGMSRAIVSNRVSYFLDVHGPSETIDTACSSSLVAIHRAINAMKNKECNLAIAGGVNVILSPSLFIALAKAQMLSPDGHCKTFDESANGYVRSEGCGFVILKPLSKAIENRDHIYAVIKGSAENHGGKAKSLTAPNPNAQAKVILSAYNGSDVDPATITYYETHGTGTKLGDPIEINGLKMAFEELYKRSGKQFSSEPHCALGSVKSTIGHLETGAGIAGLIKIILAMQNKKIPSNVNFNKQNPFIDLKETPFYIARHTHEWKQLMDDMGKAIPRRASLSSFGFGGSNCHAIFEEFVDLKESHTIGEALLDKQKLIIISAKSEGSLNTYIQKLYDFLVYDVPARIKYDMDIFLVELAYTLQVGREDMNYRLAIVVNDFDDLKNSLQVYVKNPQASGRFFRGKIKKRKSKDFDNRENQAVWDIGDFNKLADLWVNGATIDWESFYSKYNCKPCRVSLPVYCFDLKRYWIPETTRSGKITYSCSKVQKLHPLLGVNLSSFEEGKFKTTLYGSEFFLKDHVISDDRILPGVGYLEMAYNAGKYLLKSENLTLKNIIWATPIKVSDKSVECFIHLKPIFKEDESLNIPQGLKFEIRSIDRAGKVNIHSSGKILREIIQTAESKDVNHLNESFTQMIEGECCYEKFYKKGFQYGPGFQSIQYIRYNESEAVSSLKLPEILECDFSSFYLHPSIMDGALQTILGFTEGNNIEPEKVLLPFALGKIEIWKKTPAICYAYIIRKNINDKNSQVHIYDIYILTKEGEVAVKFSDFSIREYQKKVSSKLEGKNRLEKLSFKSISQYPVMYYEYLWLESSVLNSALNDQQSIWIIGDEASLFYKFKDRINTVFIQSANANKKVASNHFEVNIYNLADYSRTIKNVLEKNSFPDTILFASKYRKLEIYKQTIKKQLKIEFFAIFYLIKKIVGAKFKKDILILDLYHGDFNNFSPFSAALGGFSKTMHKEVKSFFLKTVRVDTQSSDDLFKIVADEITYGKDCIEVCYNENKRYIRRFNEFDPSQKEVVPVSIKKDGVYVITGGAGGLGLIFAEYCAKQNKTNVLLIGRSALSEDKKASIDKIKKHGSNIDYLTADMSKYKDVKLLIGKIKSIYGHIDGIIHSAGVNRDAYIINKNRETIEFVLAPKVYGTIFLDELTKDEDLDFFVTFSSTASAIGNSGQSDYSYANSFMDHYADFRNAFVAAGKRSGKSISLGWPLWKNGGMQVNDTIREILKSSIGMVPLETKNGINAFQNALNLNMNQVVVAEGIRSKLNEQFGIDSDLINRPYSARLEVNKQVSAIEGKDKINLIENDLIKIFAEFLKVDAGEIDNEAEFGDYGVDSILMMSIMNKIEETYGDTISPNALSEYPSIEELAAHLIESGIVSLDYGKNEMVSVATEEFFDMKEISGKDKIELVENDLVKIFAVLLKVDVGEIDKDAEFGDYGVDSILMMSIMNKIEETYGDTISPNALSEYPSIEELAAHLIESGIVPERYDFDESLLEQEKVVPVVDVSKITKKKKSLAVRSYSQEKTDKIAIIGMACRFPQADSIEKFWENLKAGKDCIIETPSDRWDISEHYSPGKPATPGNSYSKWAGYIDNIDCFDAAFFGVKDHDALVMDPQHRILLELTQELIDRAGYSKNDLSGTRTGVYLGASEGLYTERYRHLIAPEDLKHVIVNKISNMMAARISDFYNLRGSSLTIDTACSSSLVALHEAGKSLLSGECEMAIVGGIEILIDEFNHIAFSQSGALSNQPHSYVFDERAGGFVLGEGSGLLMLKSYDKAIAEGDNILAVLLSSAVNNDGHTLGLTVPNLEGQKDVITQALRKSRITPDTITCYEAHGTGTLLGDPIEIKAAGEAYRKSTDLKQYCAVGSVKTNIGHLLHSAGVAGLIKIILSMQNKMIPPTLHCEKPHPRFKFRESPFYPNLSLKDWVPEGGVRRAAISSFGFGGTNAHCIIEEFDRDKMGYTAKRLPLPITKFHRKRYWLGNDIVNVESKEKKLSDEEYKELLIKLSQGEITSEELLRIEGAL